MTTERIRRASWSNDDGWRSRAGWILSVEISTCNKCITILTSSPPSALSLSHLILIQQDRLGETDSKNDEILSHRDRKEGQIDSTKTKTTSTSSPSLLSSQLRILAHSNSVITTNSSLLLSTSHSTTDSTSGSTRRSGLSSARVRASEMQRLSEFFARPSNFSVALSRGEYAGFVVSEL